MIITWVKHLVSDVQNWRTDNLLCRWQMEVTNRFTPSRCGTCGKKHTWRVVWMVTNKSLFPPTLWKRCSWMPVCISFTILVPLYVCFLIYQPYMHFTQQFVIFEPAGGNVLRWDNDLSCRNWRHKTWQCNGQWIQWPCIKNSESHDFYIPKVVTWENTDNFASSTSFSENFPEQAHSIASWNTWSVLVEWGSL